MPTLLPGEIAAMSDVLEEDMSHHYCHKPDALWAVFTSDLPFDFFPWIPRSFLTFANQLYKDTTQKSWLDDNRR